MELDAARRSRHLMVPMIAALVVIVGAFAFSGAVTDRIEEEISAYAEQISENAMPSIAALALARTTLIQLDQRVNLEQRRCELNEPMGSGNVSQDLARIVREQSRLYLTFPPFPNEAALQGAIVTEGERLDSLLDQFLALVASRQCAAARDLMDGELGQTIRREAELMGRVNEINIEEARRLGEEIRHRRETARRNALFLDSLAVLLTVLAVGIVALVVRRNARLVAEYAQGQRERADELDMFASRVAHDIRSPLTAVQIGLQSVRRMEETQASVEKRLLWLDRSLASLSRVNSVIGDLLSFARAGATPAPGARTEVSRVVRELEDELRPVTEAAGMALVVEPFADCTVRCAPGVLISLLSNLAHNALKHGRSEGGTITIRVAPDHLVRFEVSDTGPGLKPGAEKRLFRPYARGDTSAPGLGLGLATVKRLSELHGGSCGVTSADGRGSTFWFTLPAAEPAPLEDRPQPTV